MVKENLSPDTTDDPTLFYDQAFSLVTVLADLLGQRQWRITCAESCTGGMIAASLTEMAGSSSWFEQGLVTYSNQAKQELLDVPAGILQTDGAVSEACVKAMAVGAQKTAAADLAISVSGIAGPDGQTPGKPVGTVWIGWAVQGEVTAERWQFAGNRRAVREQAVLCALRGIIARVQPANKSIE